MTNPQTPLDIELEPCPFCGARQAVDCHDTSGVWVERSDHDDPEYTVVCWSCGAHSKEFPSRDAAIAAWNTRPTLSPLDREAAARELLAAEYERYVGEGPYPTYAALARSGYGSFTLCSIRAIEKALCLSAQPLAPSIHTSESLVEALESCGLALGRMLDLVGPKRIGTDYRRVGGMMIEEHVQHALEAANSARTALTDTGDRG